MKEKSDCCPFCNKEMLYANPKVGCDNPKCECHKTPPMDLAAGKKIDDSDEEDDSDEKDHNSQKEENKDIKDTIDVKDTKDVKDVKDIKENNELH